MVLEQFVKTELMDLTWGDSCWRMSASLWTVKELAHWSIEDSIKDSISSIEELEVRACIRHCLHGG